MPLDAIKFLFQVFENYSTLKPCKVEFEMWIGRMEMVTDATPVNQKNLT